MQAAVDVEKGRIDAILEASTADADSFAEIVTLINSIDAENDSAFAGYVLSNDAALAQERSDFEAADTAEASARAAADLVLTNDLAAEVTRASNAEAGLAADIETEKLRAEAAELALTNGLAQEVQDRQEAVSAENAAMLAAVAAENAAMLAAVAVVQADVDLNEADGDTDRALIRTEMAANETARDASVEAIRQALQDDIDLNEADGDTARALIRTEMAADETARDAYVEAIRQALQDDIDLTKQMVMTTVQLSALKWQQTKLPAMLL